MFLPSSWARDPRKEMTNEKKVFRKTSKATVQNL